MSRQFPTTFIWYFSSIWRTQIRKLFIMQDFPPSEGQTLPQHPLFMSHPPHQTTQLRFACHSFSPLTTSEVCAGRLTVLDWSGLRLAGPRYLPEVKECQEICLDRRQTKICELLAWIGLPFCLECGDEPRTDFRVSSSSNLLSLNDWQVLWIWEWLRIEGGGNYI